MRILSYLMLVLALALAAALLAGLGWAAARIDWTHKVFLAAFWTETPEDVRNAVLVSGGVVAAAIGLALAAVRAHAADLQARAANEQARAANEQARIANAQARVAEQGHITDRFTKAIEQLGSDKLEVRLGAIYALERIARDSQRDHGPIMETLTASIRERAPWPPKREPALVEDTEGQAAEVLKPATDIQALLTVISRRRREYDVERQRLDLSATDLRGAYLSEAHLEGANLWDAHLERAHLGDAHLEQAVLGKAHLERTRLWRAHLEEADLWGADLMGANLTGANLRGADLEGANLRRADLAGANLTWANLRRADLTGANLRGADLEGANLQGAKNLAQEQLDGVYGDEKTKLPDGLTIGTGLPAAPSPGPEAERAVLG
jgi:uncharacterized protein YjbI with pentapeptide repeats